MARVDGEATVVLSTKKMFDEDTGVVVGERGVVKTLDEQPAGMALTDTNALEDARVARRAMLREMEALEEDVARAAAGRWAEEAERGAARGAIGTSSEEASDESDETASEGSGADEETRGVDEEDLPSRLVGMLDVERQAR